MCPVPVNRGQRNALLPQMQSASDRRLSQDEQALLRQCQNPQTHSRNSGNRCQQAEALLTSDLRHMGEGSKKSGQMSAEAATIRDAKDRRQRAAKLSYPSVAERFDKDDQFKARVMQEGRNMEDMQKFDYLSHAILPDPGRSEEQRHLRAGSHFTSDYTAPRQASHRQSWSSMPTAKWAPTHTPAH